MISIADGRHGMSFELALIRHATQQPGRSTEEQRAKVLDLNAASLYGFAVPRT